MLCRMFSSLSWLRAALARVSSTRAAGAFSTNLGFSSCFWNMASSFSALASSLFRRASSLSRSISSIMGIKPRAAWVETWTIPSVLPS